MKIEIEIPDTTIEFALFGAFSSGAVRYWCESVRAVPPHGGDRASTYSDAALNGGKIVVTIGEPVKHGGPTEFTIDRAAVERGLNAMLVKAPVQFGRLFDKFKADNTTYDVFVQCCLFGETVFG